MINTYTHLQVCFAYINTTKCEKAFQKAKKQIASVKVLTHYDPNLPIKLVADASAYGIGAMISHRMPDGTERPIAFASRTLTASEKGQEIPPISLRAEIYFTHRPSTMQ